MVPQSHAAHIDFYISVLLFFFLSWVKCADELQLMLIYHVTHNKIAHTNFEFLIPDKRYEEMVAVQKSKVRLHASHLVLNTRTRALGDKI